MKNLLKVFSCALLMFLPFSSFSTSARMESNNMMYSARDIHPSFNSYYVVQVIVTQTGHSGGDYDYQIYAYVYDPDSNPIGYDSNGDPIYQNVSIPGPLTVYGTVTYSDSAVSIEIPSSGEAWQTYNSIPQLTSSTLHVTGLSEDQIGGDTFYLNPTIYFIVQ